MLRSLALAAALPALAFAQSPLETTFSNPAPGFVVINTPSPITGLLDITVTEPTGIVLTQVDMQVSTTHGTNGQFAVYITAPGVSHVGNELNAAAWTQVSTATTVHAGGRVSFMLQTPVSLSAASYGMAFHCIEANPIYHGGAVSATLPQTYTSAELTIDMSAMLMRVSDPVDPFGGVSFSFSPRQLAIGMFYTVGGTSVDFSGTPRTGPSPLAVQFTSIATSGVPGGILAYVWDFDNDGTPDATTPNPSFTYTNCGSYTVSLQIIDASGSISVTKADYVVTDVVTPDFENEIVGVNTVSFTDTSSPTPSQWAWDFDGDGATDSTVQNPVFVFANGCAETTVTLTTTLACQPPTSLTRAIAVASSIETTFAGPLVTTTAALSSANYLDVDVTNPLGITVCSAHVNSGLAVGTPLIVNLYQTEGTYVGKTSDVSLWRLVASETIASAGPGTRTFVPLTTPLHLASGTFGICMEHIGASPTYSNVGAPFVVSNSDVTITAGLSQGEPVFDPAAATFSPRVANIALHYSTSQATGAAGYGYIGSGCAGTLGVPTNVANAQPVLGGTAQFAVDNLPLGIGIMALGTARSVPPIDLAIVGMPGCPLHHNAAVLLTMLGAGTSATFDFPIPNNPMFIGTQIFTQAASLDVGLNTLGFALSDAAVMLVGQ
ncbi:MAG: PKD repeat protein [Planctomycetota bacterium]|jgi:PKD repeat protein